ncbi:la-related protein 1C-like [Diospyros lotus]|uniref:la-related protein 1C-like n=1 Tax=Diospyros lotus TaxID=55363 RepID=UPI00225B0765|nr:la-related protein 1C-like [Diospyros lotus]
MPNPIIEALPTNIEKSEPAVSEYSSRSDHVPREEGRFGLQFRNGNGYLLPRNTLIGRSNINAANTTKSCSRALHPTPTHRPAPLGPTPFSPFPKPMVGLFCNPIVRHHQVQSPGPAMFNGMPLMPPSIPRSPAIPTDPQLHASIVKQIEYYFSKENLVKDTFLREKMDGQGWVPIRVIANFNRVKLLTNNIRLILRVLRTNSTVVEVQGNRVPMGATYQLANEVCHGFFT